MTPPQQLATFKVLHPGSNTLATSTYFRPPSLDCVTGSGLLLLPLFSSLNTVASDTVKLSQVRSLSDVFHLIHSKNQNLFSGLQSTVVSESPPPSNPWLAFIFDVPQKYSVPALGLAFLP